MDELSEKALLFTKELENTQIDQAPVSMSVRLIWKNGNYSYNHFLIN